MRLALRNLLNGRLFRRLQSHPRVTSHKSDDAKSDPASMADHSHFDVITTGKLADLESVNAKLRKRLEQSSEFLKNEKAERTKSEKLRTRLQNKLDLSISSYKEKNLKLRNDIRSIKREHSWYRWYFSEYASALRRHQYAVPTLDIDNLIFDNSDEFLPIEDFLRGIVHPTETHGAYSNDFIYYAARFLPLPSTTGTYGYAVSYVGNGEFAHSGKAFDTLIMPDHWRAERTGFDRPFGLANRWIAENGWRSMSFTPEGTLEHYRPMSYNTGDVDGDGAHDFIFGTWLILSSRGYEPVADVPRETIFVDGKLISYDGGRILCQKWAGESVQVLDEINIPHAVLQDLPHVLMPLPGGFFGLRTERGLNILTVDSTGKMSHHGWIEGLSAGEIQTGAFGDFDGDGQDEFWLSQVATITRPETQDHLTLISPSRIRPGCNLLSDVASFKIRGSRKYSDYDGISSTLSPLAGDIDGCGRPDLTFTGHRHMAESGALYVLQNKFIKTGGEIDLTDRRIVKIRGRDMSQIAPPFQHWDASDFLGEGRDGIIVPADNDLLAGLNAGAIYLLSGKDIFPE